MITGSINSNVAQRTSYYGMLRCLGAGKIRFGCLSGWKLFSGVKLLFQQDVCWESFPHGDCVPFCVDLSARSSALYQCLASARSVLSVVPRWDLSRFGSRHLLRHGGRQKLLRSQQQLGMWWKMQRILRVMLGCLEVVQSFLWA